MCMFYICIQTTHTHTRNLRRASDRRLLRARFAIVMFYSGIEWRCICLSSNSMMTIGERTLDGELNVRQALCAVSVRPSSSYNPSLWVLLYNHTSASHVLPFLGGWVSMTYDRWTVYGIKPVDPVSQRSSTLLHDSCFTVGHSALPPSFDAGNSWSSAGVVILFLSTLTVAADV